MNATFKAMSKEVKEEFNHELINDGSNIELEDDNGQNVDNYEKEFCIAINELKVIETNSFIARKII